MMRTPTELRDHIDLRYPNEPNPFRLYRAADMARIGKTVSLSDPRKLVKLRRSLRGAAYLARSQRASLPPDESPAIRKRWLKKNLLEPAEKLEKNIRSLAFSREERRRLNDFWPAIAECPDEPFDLEILTHLSNFKASVNLTMSYLSQPLGMKPKSEYRHELVFAFLKVFSDSFPELIIRRSNDGERIKGPFVEFIRAAAVPILGEGRLLNAEILCAVSYHSYMKKMADF